MDKAMWEFRGNRFNTAILNFENDLSDWGEGAAEELGGCLLDVGCATTMLGPVGELAGLSNIASSANVTGYTANNVSHMLAAKHELGPLLKKFGSGPNAIRAVQKAAQSSLSAGTYAKGMWVSIKVGGMNIAVKGAFVGGKFRIGTMTMAPFK